jgi:lipid A 3-O-deacylase
MCCIYLISTTAFSQTIDNTASFRMSPAESLLRLHYGNDYFTGSDEYYTQGMNLEFISPALKRNPLSRLLIIPKENNNQLGLAIEHNAYTPTSISFNKILYGDRPFAASLLLKTFAGSSRPLKRYRITSSLSLGVIGKAAGAHQIQQTIHKWINDTDPQGWQYQIKNDLIMNYELGIEKNIFQSKHFLLNGMASARVGTLNTKFSVGGTMMLGKLNSEISSIFSTIHVLQKQKFTFHLYAQPVINTVVYDATLQGGIVFNRDSPYTLTNKEIEHFTLQGNTGLVFTLGYFNIEYFQSILSKEFTTGHHHRWGGLRIGILL